VDDIQAVGQVTTCFSYEFNTVGHGVKAAKLQGVHLVRDPGQVQQPPRTLHKQDPQAAPGGQQHELPGPDGEDSNSLNNSRFL